MQKLSYKDAGVDIDAGNDFVRQIIPAVKSTYTGREIGGIGSFAGAFELPEGYKKPVILGATDGVGTKLKLAIDSGKFDTIGIDLVAMCVNDLICNFAKPLFFLDYYASAKLEIGSAVQVVNGIAKGCIQAECSLIGGETAEMPGLYKEGDFDLAGFAVGVAEKEELLRDRGVSVGDVLIALPSSGIHSNGYSLARKLLLEKLGMKFDDIVGGKKLIDILLEPTKIYVKTFLANQERIKALAHITGGGIVENLPRALPKNVDAIIDESKIRTLSIYELMGAHVEKAEMYRAFNMGVGMVWVVAPENVDAVLANSEGYVIGSLTSGSGEAKIV